MLLKLLYALESPGGFSVKTALPDSTLRVLDSLIPLDLELAGDFAFLASSQVLLLLVLP